ncbi:hypothetical protein PACTADRAFT_140174 [Pachysolen tannophilus NRRL Y-2460]|uniref:Uncharacterized protein n=1 Tax=Pachysolen tannophilus NRRL Y-2460 TaxID=669874 RepID=A0A1E4U0T5_PACTA|nr:hypothetical protein PACTADRAFT_140174 [Pachysolen tannophilus NRRL Y-2460]
MMQGVMLTITMTITTSVLETVLEIVIGRKESLWFPSVFSTKRLDLNLRVGIKINQVKKLYKFN